MSSNKEVITNSLQETQAFAEKFAEELKPGDIIALSGELGAGKTTVVQGFAKGLGITNRIISPTFIIARSYEIKNPNKKLEKFYHIDLYRINSEKDLEGLGMKEILSEKDAVVVIEWPERLGSFMPEKRWEIKIESLGENERKININKLLYC